jgi:glucose/arabinose dehydrogenase
MGNVVGNYFALMKFNSVFTRVLSVLALTISAVVAQSNLPSVDLKVAWPNLKFNRPVAMVEAPDGSHRQFLVEQDGRVWILPTDRNGSEPKLFLDISDRRPHQDNEEGLLCMAFHPQFKTNGKFYVFYTQQGPRRNILSEFQVSKTDPAKADLASERQLFRILKEWSNHNGATLAFGPDGYLYITVGDGGAGYDPHEHGQDLNVVYGKILRIDVNSKTGSLPYGIPLDNPFLPADKQALDKIVPFDDVGRTGQRPEIWAYGVRNPWRVSFDRETGELWVGDVGQDRFEEVDIIKKGGNYGWSAREGFHDLNRTSHPVKGSAAIDPIIEYGHNPDLARESKFPNHSIGISITGGYVYRGKKIPALRGMYVYADFQMGTIWGLRYENDKLTADGVLVKGNPSRNIPSFAEDSDGELYVLSFDGQIYQIEGSK